ncbi:transglutaminase-like domain-containing protein [Marinobacter halotolerans]|uniref:transglutaminase-like domain-containing protein n=1 Tax=Marinobacter halotolerans TaxID=1569211 RepID=UPI001CD996F4|nr:transglutaminase family protein [Marinobacter halotolerans]
MEETYLKPAYLVESDSPEVEVFASKAASGSTTDYDIAIKLYNAVRDAITYDPYQDFRKESTFSAKDALNRGRGFCIPKAALLAACARAQNIPARLGFADVKNHLASKRMIDACNGDVFRWHAYCELFIADKWVKATPAFDRKLCERTGLTPLEFDGKNDSIFHSFDNNRRHMEYLNYHGLFAGVPYQQIIATWEKLSPGLLDKKYLAGRASFSDDLESDKP